MVIDKLSDLHMEILNILNHEAPGTYLTTGQIGEKVDNKFLEYNRNQEYEDYEIMSIPNPETERSLFIANRLGPILGYLKKRGLVIQKKLYARKPGAASAWTLGPVSDLLKEQGVLKDDEWEPESYKCRFCRGDEMASCCDCV